MHVSSINGRLAICMKCPIYSPTKGMCNPKLWLNPETNEVSTSAKSGFIRGCGCLINVKVRNMNNHCIAGKW